MSESETVSNNDIIIIKKYANRRLYNTETSCYITLDDVRELVKNGDDFIVQDAKSGQDLTRQILTQIIFEQELTGKSILPTNFLKRVIELYDDNVSEMIPSYLENSMEAFVANQDKLRTMMNDTWKGFNPISQFQEISKQNSDMFSQAFSMFNPLDNFFSSNQKKDDEK